MVEPKNILNFCNLLIILCFWIAVIDNYRLISKEYKPINFIINTFIMLISFVLLFIRIYPEKIILDLKVDIVNLVNFILQITCGIFMFGLSNISIGIGVFCVVNSLFNLFVFIFIDNIKQDTNEIKSDDT